MPGAKGQAGNEVSGNTIKTEAIQGGRKTGTGTCEGWRAGGRGVLRQAGRKEDTAKGR